MAAGLSREEASRKARLEFGSPEKYKEEMRQARGLSCSTSCAPISSTPHAFYERARHFR
jgi:hypothetical protein